jgi:hypothetical protein
MALSDDKYEKYKILARDAIRKFEENDIDKILIE